MSNGADSTPASLACASSPCGSTPSGGPGQRPDLALESFRRKIETAPPVVINGDGSQRRDLTHVEDVARAIELAIHWPGPGSAVLNVGTGKNHSAMYMVEAATKTAAPQGLNSFLLCGPEVILGFDR